MLESELNNPEFLDEINRLRRRNEELESSLSDAKRETESLKANEESYRRLFDDASIGIFRSTPDGKGIAVNPALARMFGYESPEEIIISVKKIGEDLFVDPSQRTEIMRQIEQRQDKKSFECQYRRKDGNILIGNLNISAFKDPEGRIIHWEGFIEDITERKRVEEELRIRSILLSTYLEVSLDGILIVDENGRILLFNQRFVDMCGIPPEIIEAKSDELILQMAFEQVADPEEFIQRVKFLYEHKQGKSREKIILKDGKVFDRYSTPLFLDDGSYYGRIWILRDITMRIQAENAIKQSEKKFRLLFESSADPILLLDEANCISNCNKAAVKILGAISKEMLIGKPTPTFTPEYQPDGRLSSEKGMEMYQKVVESGSASSEWTHIRMDGSAFTVDASITRIPIGRRNVFLIHWHEIIDSKKASQECETQIGGF
jgi:PAS domain S-box-containing protein